jgi:hypothetical protein
VKPASEAELAAVVIEWLEVLGADVYQEVELRRQGIRADIVAKVQAELWIIETKTSMSVALIEQAMARRRFVHRIYVAVPEGRSRGGLDLCRELGIGVLSVRVGTDGTYDASKVKLLTPSQRWNSRPLELSSRLLPEHKTHARAGAQTGGHWSMWRQTCEAIAKVVRAGGQDGVSIKEAVSDRYHYFTLAGARSSIATWARQGKIPGVRCEGGRMFAIEASK